MLLIEFIKFVFYSSLIVIISKYVLVVVIRKIAENLNLKPKIIGEITGISTSVPELLTITTSSIIGLTNASIYNILSSNIINLIQYSITIILNNNFKIMKNKAIKFDILLVIITIIIPIFLLYEKIKIDIYSVPIFMLLFIFFIYLNSKVHLMYLKEPYKEDIREINDKKISSIYKNIIILIIVSVLLFFISNNLGNILEVLCLKFNIPQYIIGILLGFITSIPELITFFEAQKYYKVVKDDMYGVIEATNNLFTSNIINLFIVQTIGIIITNVFI